MKKILSVLLVIAMLITSCIMFTSCAEKKVSVGDVEKNTTETLNTAIDGATANFFGDDAGINSIIEKAIKSGAITVTFDSEDVLSALGLKSIKGTLYMNQADMKAVTDLLLATESDTLSARVFLSKDGILLNSQDILGDTTYGIYPQKLADNFSTSSLAQLTGVPQEELNDVVDTFKEFAKAYKDIFEKAGEIANNTTDEILALFDQTVGEEKVEIDGKETTCIAIVYTINNKTIEKLAKYIADEAKALFTGVEGFSEASLNSEINELIEELNENAKIDLKYTMYISKETGNLTMCDFDGSLTIEEQKLNIDGEVIFGDNKITIEYDMKADGHSAGIDAEILKSTSGNTVTYDLSISAKSDNATMDILTGSYEYDTNNGDFELSVALASEITNTLEKQKLVISGNITKRENYASVAIDKVSFAGETVNVGLTIEYDAAATMPEVPANVKDVLDFTQADIEKLGENIMNSKLAQLIEDFQRSMQSNSALPDYSSDYDYYY